MANEPVELRDNGDIIVGEGQVGYLGWSENMLVDISVDEGRQGEGIATEAVRQLVERLRADGYTKITTTTVVSGAMEVVLSRNGFEQKVVEKELSVSERLEDELDEPPTREEVEWVKRL